MFALSNAIVEVSADNCTYRIVNTGPMEQGVPVNEYIEQFFDGQRVIIRNIVRRTIGFLTLRGRVSIKKSTIVDYYNDYLILKPEPGMYIVVDSSGMSIGGLFNTLSEARESIGKEVD